LNLSNSKNNEHPINDQLLDLLKIFNQNNNDTQDSQQYYKNYELCQKKDKGTPNYKSKQIKKTTTQFIPNKNFDFSADTEESMDERRDQTLNRNLINKVSSIKPKTNDINNLDKQSFINSSIRMNTMDYARRDQMNNYRTYNVEREDICIQSGSFTATTYMNLNSINPPRMFGPLTPPKLNPRIDFNNLITNCHQPGYDMYCNSMNNNTNTFVPNQNSYSNYPLINRGSIISNSTYYSSNTKNKQGNLDQDTTQDLVDSSINEEYKYILI